MFLKKLASTALTPQASTDEVHEERGWRFPEEQAEVEGWQARVGRLRRGAASPAPSLLSYHAAAQPTKYKLISCG